MLVQSYNSNPAIEDRKKELTQTIHVVAMRYKADFEQETKPLLDELVALSKQDDRITIIETPIINADARAIADAQEVGGTTPKAE